jgi:Flp pilus assembly protein TadB
MDENATVFAALSGLLVLAAGVAAWRLHRRRRLKALERRLSEAESSRQNLAATAATLHRRLVAADRETQAADLRERKEALERALAAAAPAQSRWQDTLPFTQSDTQPDTQPDTLPGGEFLPTQPMPVEGGR